MITCPDESLVYGLLPALMTSLTPMMTPYSESFQGPDTLSDWTERFSRFFRFVRNGFRTGLCPCCRSVTPRQEHANVYNFIGNAISGAFCVFDAEAGIDLVSIYSNTSSTIPV